MQITTAVVPGRQLAKHDGLSKESGLFGEQAKGQMLRFETCPYEEEEEKKATLHRFFLFLQKKILEQMSLQTHG